MPPSPRPNRHWYQLALAGQGATLAYASWWVAFIEPHPPWAPIGYLGPGLAALFGLGLVGWGLMAWIE
jgi:hypothetical protein